MLSAIRNLDPDLKRGAFVITCLYATVFAAGVILCAATGEPGLMIAAVALFGSTAALAGIIAAFWRAAIRLFPSKED